jgi:transcriptional regulator with XRE-family HTH domain
MEQDLNRPKVVLVERKRTSKWLAEKLGKNPTTISKWCQNKIQPDLSTLNRIANLLDVDIKDLITSNKSYSSTARILHTSLSKIIITLWRSTTN